MPKIASLPPLGLVAPRRRQRKLKYLLPMVALCLVSLIVIWPQIKLLFQTHGHALHLSLPGEVNAAIEPIYRGVDQTHQKYTLKAQQGIEIAPDTYQLESPDLIFDLNTGEKIHVTADEGEYRHLERKIYLNKNVYVDHSLGYDFVTDRAMIDVTTTRIWGQDPVNGNSPTGIINSQGFEILDKGNRILFGQPKVVS